MATRLTKMKIDRVSLVDKGANRRRFAILKRAGQPAQMEEPTMARPQTFAEMIRRVSKKTTATFDELQAAQDLRAWLPDATRSLTDVVAAAIAPASDAEDVPAETRLRAVTNSVGQFGQELEAKVAAVLAQMPTPVKKGAAGWGSIFGTTGGRSSDPAYQAPHDRISKAACGHPWHDVFGVGH